MRANQWSMLRFVFFLSIVIPGYLFGQDQTNARVEFLESPEVQQVVQNYIHTNRTTSFIKGWRVQILSTTDRERLDQVRNSFRAQYPYLAIASTHNRPYYMLRVGAFTDKLEAIRLQQYLRPYYPSAYIIQDNEIEPQQLLGSVN